MLGALFERYGLRRVHKFGHVPELLITFGLSYLIVELVQLIWGRAVGALPRARRSCDGPLFTLFGTQFPDVPRLHDAGGAADAGCRSGCC